MIGRSIRKFRQAAGLTQEDLAFAAGVSREYVNQLEADKSSPTFDTLLKIAKPLNVVASIIVHDAEHRPETGLLHNPAKPKRMKCTPSKTPSTSTDVSASETFFRQRIGDLLHRWRKEARITRRIIAGKLDQPRQYVIDLEEGQRSIDYREFLLWCKACRRDPKKVAIESLNELGWHEKSH